MTIRAVTGVVTDGADVTDLRAVRPRAFDADAELESAHAIALRAVAEARGIADPLCAPETLLMRHHGRVLAVRNGRRVAGIDEAAEARCDDKLAMRTLFAARGLPCPATLGFDAPEEVWERFLRAGPVVVKPIAGTHGRGVTLGIRSLPDARAAAGHLALGGVASFAERQVAGHDLRVHVIAGKIVAACTRRPAFIEGDGRRSARTLAAEHEATLRALNSNNALDWRVAEAMLGADARSLDDVPAQGEVWVLGRLSNVAAGAVVDDASGRLHPDVAEAIVRLDAAIELPTWAVDIMAPAPDAPLSAVSFLEVNARPEWLHHRLPRAGERDLGAALVEAFVAGQLDAWTQPDA